MDIEAEVVSAFVAMRRTHPSWRVGQLVTYVAAFAKRDEPGGVWAMEDEEFVAAINRELYESPTAPPTPHLRVAIEEVASDFKKRTHSVSNAS